MAKDKTLNIKTFGDGLDAVRTCFADALEKADLPELAKRAKSADRKTLEDLMKQPDLSAELRAILSMCWNKFNPNT